MRRLACLLGAFLAAAIGQASGAMATRAGDPPLATMPHAAFLSATPARPGAGDPAGAALALLMLPPLPPPPAPLDPRADEAAITFLAPPSRLLARTGPSPWQAPLATVRPLPRPGLAYSSAGGRLRVPPPDCGGAVCIRLDHRIEDTCTAIERLATRHKLPPGFFARLIWRESLFDPYAISPAGALGIAQFMPGTAQLRGLADPFNPAEALAASAAYLADLRDGFGNLGLAAAAYNGGEQRVTNYVAKSGGLAGETLAYVQAITGHSARSWRDSPPKEVDLRLDKEKPFAEACVALASARRVPQFRTDPAVALAPWAVIVAAHDSKSVVVSRYKAVARRNPILQRNEPVYAKVKLASMRSAQYTAQIGRNSRAEAVQLCNQVKQYGGVCAVLRN